jgi:hypothetical protein
VAIVAGEHGTANQFARDEVGRGIPAAAVHEHADPGSFLLFAFGEQLAIDPGYLDFPDRDRFAKPKHHNMILVNGKGPIDPFDATILWRDRTVEPPSDGQSTLGAALDTGFLDAVTVTSSYGGSTPNITPGGVPIPPAVPPSRITRRFLFADHRYLVVADDVRAPDARNYTWLLHGNGGPGSDGTFSATPTGGEWAIRGARLTGAFAFDAGAAGFSTTSEPHYLPTDEERTHTVLRAERSGQRVRSVSMLVPTHGADAAPEVETLAVAGGAALALRDAAADRVALAVHRAPGPGETSLDAPAFGLRESASDGSVWNFDARGDGSLRHAFAEDAKVLRYDGTTLLESASVGSLGIRPEATRAELIAETADPAVAVGGLGFVPLAADGACALDTGGAATVVSMNRNRVVVLRDAPGNSAPAADASRSPKRAAVGNAVVLDASASCDLDGDALAFAWELISAPAGSAWSLGGADVAAPTLDVDARGPFRVRLVVTDAHGAASRPAEFVVYGGDSCEDHVDQDLDGLIDRLDPQCPSPGEGAGLGCGVTGFEFAPLLVWALTRRRRAASAGGRVSV